LIIFDFTEDYRKQLRRDDENAVLVTHDYISRTHYGAAYAHRFARTEDHLPRRVKVDSPREDGQTDGADPTRVAYSTIDDRPRDALLLT
jgi:hypothetical protein